MSRRRSGLGGRLGGDEPSAMLIDELLQDRENKRIDFKRDASSPRGIVKDFAAFSNTAGGYIVIGVDDDGEIVGLDDPQDAEEAISSCAYELVEPKLTPTCSTTTHEGHELIVIGVAYYNGPELIGLTEKGDTVYYERVGSTSRPIEPERLEELRRERQGTSGFDELSARGATLDDLDMETIEARFGEQGIELDDAALQNYKLAVEENKELVPTRGAILLFGLDPSPFLPDARFRCIRYPGATRGGDVIDQDNYESVALLAGMEAVEAFIARNHRHRARAQRSSASRHPSLQPRGPARGPSQRDRPYRLQPLRQPPQHLHLQRSP